MNRHAHSPNTLPGTPGAPASLRTGSRRWKACLLAGTLFAGLAALTARAGWTQGPAAGGPTFFFAGGRKQVLAPSVRWAGVQMQPGASAKALAAPLAAPGVLAADREAQSFVKDIVLLPVDARASLATRQKIQGQLAQSAGVKRLVRVFDNGDIPVIETDEFLIRFDAKVGTAQVHALLDRYGAAVVRRLGAQSPNGWVARVKDPTRLSSIAVANALYGKPGVVWSQPNLIWPKRSRASANDRLYPTQWHLRQGFTGRDINVERAWDFGYGDSDIVVAVIDDGFDLDHEDMQGGKWVSPWDFRNNDSNPRPTAAIADPGDGSRDDAHGTVVSGIIAANGNNSIGVSGVAPGCRIMPIRLISPGWTLDAEADAFRWAADQGADIINCSWGPADNAGAAALPDSTKDAIDYCTSTGRPRSGMTPRGILITWAAGNGQEPVMEDPNHPQYDGYAAYSKVMCVSSTDPDDTFSDAFSDFGDAVDISAPGSSMVSTDLSGNPGYRGGTDNNSNYVLVGNGTQGTSFSAPTVAGVAALILSQQPDLHYQILRSHLLASAKKVDTANGNYSNGRSNLYGFGRVDAGKAFDGIGRAKAEVVDPAHGTTIKEFKKVNGTIPTLITRHYNDGSWSVERVQLYLRRNSDSMYWDYKVQAWKSAKVGWDYPQGKNYPSIRFLFQYAPMGAKLPDGEYTAEAVTYDGGGDRGTGTSTFRVDANPPTATITLPKPNVLLAHLSPITGTASDPTGGTGVKSVGVMIKRISDSATWNGSTWVNQNVYLAADYDAAKKTWMQVAGLPKGAGLTSGARYAITAQASDFAGNTAQSAPVNVTADVSGPIPTVSAPTQGATVGSLLKISGKALDNPGGIGVWHDPVRMILQRESDGKYWNGGSWVAAATPPLLSTTYTTSTGVWHCTQIPPVSPTGLAHGRYRIRVRASDLLGNEGRLAAGYWDSSAGEYYHSFTVEESAPTAMIRNPAHASTVSALPTIVCAATDTGGSGLPPENSTVKLILQRESDLKCWDGSKWIAPATPKTPPLLDTVYHTASGTWRRTTGLPPITQDASGLMNGEYRVKARVTDRAGNVGVKGLNGYWDDEAQEPYSLFTVEQAKPTATIVTPLHRATVASLPKIECSAADNAGGTGLDPVNATVQLVLQRESDDKYWNGTSWVAAAATNPPVLATTYNSATGRWVRSSGLPAGLLATNGLLSGPYRIRARVIDRAGNLGQVAAGYWDVDAQESYSAFTVEQVRPTVTMVTPVHKSTVSTLPSLVCKAADNNGGSGLEPVSATVRLILQRESDDKYWDGAKWVVAAPAAAPLLATVYNAAAGTWRRDSGLPAGTAATTGLLPGAYRIRAVLVDRAGNPGGIAPTAGAWDGTVQAYYSAFYVK